MGLTLARYQSGGSADILAPVALLSISEALDALSAADPPDQHGAAPFVAVELRGADPSFWRDGRNRLMSAAIDNSAAVVLGVIDSEVDTTQAALIDSFDVLLSPHPGSPTAVDVADVDDAIAVLNAAITASPQASIALVKLLRLTHQASVPAALHAESLTYAMLQTGVTFRRWLSGRPQASPTIEADPAVLVHREDTHLRIQLNRPDRRNALNTTMRDQWYEALQLLLFDTSLDGAVVSGAGPNFSAGGDLDEFGSTPSPAVGHQVRSERSLPELMHRLRDRVRVHLHGTCVGAGIELPAFSQNLLADEATTFRLPEIGFGLVPGAGGTVSVTRRCGRHRAAWMALTGTAIDAPTALRWQLIDRIAPLPSSHRPEAHQ